MGIQSDQQALTTAVRQARSAGRDVLLEPEADEVLRALGLRSPAHVVLPHTLGSEAAARLACSSLDGEQVVVKVLSPELLHKTDVGGVRVVVREPREVAAAIEDMRRALSDYALDGFSAHEHVDYDAGLGGELLFGIRFAADFGPIVTFGAGGIAAEHLGRSLEAGRDIAILSPGLTDPECISSILAPKAISAFVTGGLRGQPGRVAAADLAGLLLRFMQFAERWCPDPIAELEINPLVWTARGPTALDAWVKLGGPASPGMPPRPLAKLTKLLRPSTIAVVGVSTSRNPGRIIVQNCLRDGFDPERLWIVKPGIERLDGCRCVPTIQSLPERVDLLVVSVPADAAVGLVEEAIRRDKAESILVIPGGMGEHPGTAGLQQRLSDSIRRARSTVGGGPIVTGGNSMGIRSRPGRYDTTFVPSHKMPRSDAPAAPFALLSQSGAFAASMSARLAPLTPRYLVTVGNQVDLTLGDYLQHLQSDPEVRVFGCHVEGFRPLDGRHWLHAARRIGDSGRAVVLHRAGRTAAGARASASHTAAIAGDYEVTRELCAASGVLVAESLDEFEALTKLCCRLGSRSVGGRLGALSNAGYECVAIADHMGSLELGAWTHDTVETLSAQLETNHLGSLVSPHNPIDVSPMMGDSGFVDAARTVLEDPTMDVAIVGCVPMTGALQTLAPSEGHDEDLTSPTSVATGLAKLWRETTKAWVCVVDGGPGYHALSSALEQAGIPTFQSADFAARMLDRYVRWRLDSTSASQSLAARQ